VQLFPERDRGDRRFLLIALALSLAVHLSLSFAWPLFRHGAEPPAERVVAKLEPITIERLPPSPTPAPTPTPTPPPREAQARSAPPRVASPKPATPPLALVPKIALPTYAPRAEPTPAQPHATVHVAPSRTLAQVRMPAGASGSAASGGLNTQQIAALDATFRKTIDQAQQAAAAAPKVDRPAAVQTMKRYDNVLHASPTDIVGFDGPCDPLDGGTTRGPYTYYYIRCNVHFDDGYVETVSFPWPYKFTRREDPFIGRGVTNFPAQPPPSNFVLPHPFALSRSICMYYRDDCLAVVKREQQNGNVP
jgi:hypothetical protein